jgi:outer membrane protein OmpA-like peptidoglycan-associated protein
MKRTSRILLATAMTAALGACSSTPERIESLETARAIVPQVEASPRAGVAATYIAEARKSLDRANQLADKGGKLPEIDYEANLAAKNAQIANEKILTAQAREEIEKGTAERQAVLIEVREREAQMKAQQAAEAEHRASALEQELAELRAKPTPRGMVLTLGDVLFDTGKSTLKAGAYRTIDKVADALKNEPSQKVMIEGHTDSVGSEEFNMELSQRRAQSVQAALLERGVKADQIQAIGRGETTPVASNDNAGGRQQNRRVELVFANTGSQVASDTN